MEVRGLQVDQLKFYWYLEKDPDHKFVPASNEQFQIEMESKFPWNASEESESEQRNSARPFVGGACGNS